MGPHHAPLLYRSTDNLGVLLDNSLGTFSPQIENQKKPEQYCQAMGLNFLLIYRGSNLRQIKDYGVRPLDDLVK